MKYLNDIFISKIRACNLFTKNTDCVITEYKTARGAIRPSRIRNYCLNLNEAIPVHLKYNCSKWYFNGYITLSKSCNIHGNNSVHMLVASPNTVSK